MATREENLKKINEDLEKLSDEQLEQIAGGVFNPPKIGYPPKMQIVDTALFQRNSN